MEPTPSFIFASEENYKAELTMHDDHHMRSSDRSRDDHQRMNSNDEYQDRDAGYRSRQGKHITRASGGDGAFEKDLHG